MRKENLHPVIKAILLVAAVAGGIVFSVTFFYGLQGNGVFGAVNQSAGVALFVSALVLFLIVLCIFRLTKVNWFWSMFSGAIAIVIYFIFVSSILRILDLFIEGWLWG